MSQFDEKKVIYKKEVIVDIKSELIDIKMLSNDERILKKVEKIIKLIENKDEDLELSVEEMIYKKMKETQDNDLNVKLYMLYRKLQSRKVSEEDALKQYEILCGQEYVSGFIY